MDTRTRVRTLYSFVNETNVSFDEPESFSGEMPGKSPGKDTVVIQKGVHELLAQLYREAEQSNPVFDRP